MLSNQELYIGLQRAIKAGEVRTFSQQCTKDNITRAALTYRMSREHYPNKISFGRGHILFFDDMFLCQDVSAAVRSGRLTCYSDLARERKKTAQAVRYTIREQQSHLSLKIGCYVLLIEKNW